MKNNKNIQDGFTSDSFWNYHPQLPLQFAPYFNTPFGFVSAFKYWLKTWNPLGTQFLFLVLAIVVWLFFTPSLERVKTFSFDWVFEIWLRDMILILSIAGGLHLYLHTFKKQGKELKYYKRDLGQKSRRFHFGSQNVDNMFWTLTTGVLCWTFWESLILWCFANNVIGMTSFTDNPIWFVVSLSFIPLWTFVYFDLQHRVMHTEWLYKHIHSWHHKNDNTGPWSGLAMHPVEQFVLMSDTLIFFLLHLHPIHLIYDLIFHGIGAPTSHAGFEKLKLGKRWSIHIGDFYHQLHHRFFYTNYGTLDTPWDKLSGNYHDGTLESHKLMVERRKAAQ